MTLVSASILVKCVFWKCSGHLLYLVSYEGSCEFPQDVQGSWVISENLKKKKKRTSQGNKKKTQKGTKSELINL